MKKLFVAAVMLLATFTLATAQQRQGMSPEERAKTQTERLEKLLSLTADQKAKVHAIELQIGKEMTAERQRTQGDRDAMRAAMQKVNTKRDAEYRKVLTADQYKKYLEDNEQRARERQRSN